MACHGELAADRPPPTDLTEFYLWMSLGGVLGGAFNGLVAPILFPWTLEYPLAVVLACRLCPWPEMVEASGRRFQLAALAGLVLLMMPFAGRLDAERPIGLVVLVVACVPLALVLFAANRPKAFALAVALPLLGDKVAAPFPGEVIFTGRGYFGVHRVIANQDARHRYHHLVHGGTVHGRQCRDEGRLCEPLTYYHRSGPLGVVFEAIQAEGQPPRRVAVVGLGAGATACYAEKGWDFTFYEIDPLVKHVAETPAYFSYLDGCAQGTCRIVLGDGRLKLSEAADASYGLIVLDAFSSDAVPIHLLTREAIQQYLARSTPDGLLVFNTTNNHLDLEGVVRDLAADAGLLALTSRDLKISDREFSIGKAPATYVVLARRREDFHDLDTDPRWRALPPREGAVPWSDDFSNVIGALKWW
jgi:spermidine synthase